MRYLQRITILIFVCACILLGWTKYKLSLRDTVVPEIVDSVGNIRLRVADQEDALLQGLTARDDRDGDLSDKIMVERVSRFSEPGVCRVSYVVFDSSNNFCRYERTVTYEDYELPHFQLEKPLMYQLTDSITLLDRVRLVDCLDGDLSHKLKIESSNVFVGEAGTYEIEFRAVNNYGQEVYAKLPLNVASYPVNAPEIVLSQYLVYTNVHQPIDPLDYVDRIRDNNGTILPMDQIRTVCQVNFDQAGSGQFRLEVTNSQGITGITYLAVIVEEE